MAVDERFLQYANAITEILKNIKAKYAVNQKQLALIFGISQSTMSRWFSGHYKFKLSDIDIIEQIFGLSIINIKENR
jgi:transcriptional regulator with XRE-family HTH domain